jgi:hypothetical protein
MNSTYVFYLAWTPGPGRQAIDLTDGTTAWLRVEPMPTDDVEEALDLAAPRADETIMNSHERGCVRL